MQQLRILFALSLLGLLACADQRAATETPTAAPPAAEMTTTGEPMIEPAGEWTNLLTDNLDNWHSYGQDAAGPAWKLDADGAVYLDTSKKNDNGGVIGGGDLTTDESYANYELELEWKIGECGNSGIIYNVTEAEEFGASYLTGPEMQVLDNSCHPDAKIVTHRAGDLYDMITAEPENVKPAGEWNKVRLVVTDGYVEHWLNGERVVTYENDTDEWRAMIGESKFKDWASFGATTSGKIALQDHSDPVWYRNVRIRDVKMQ